MTRAGPLSRPAEVRPKIEKIAGAFALEEYGKTKDNFAKFPIPAG